MPEATWQEGPAEACWWPRFGPAAPLSVGRSPARLLCVPGGETAGSPRSRSRPRGPAAPTAARRLLARAPPPLTCDPVPRCSLANVARMLASSKSEADIACPGLRGVTVSVSQNNGIGGGIGTSAPSGGGIDAAAADDSRAPQRLWSMETHAHNHRPAAQLTSRVLRAGLMMRRVKNSPRCEFDVCRDTSVRLRALLTRCSRPRGVQYSSAGTFGLVEKVTLPAANNERQVGGCRVGITAHSHTSSSCFPSSKAWGLLMGAAL
jgi:hypothetical protein